MLVLSEMALSLLRRFHRFNFGHFGRIYRVSSSRFLLSEHLILFSLNFPSYFRMFLQLDWSITLNDLASTVTDKTTSPH